MDASPRDPESHAHPYDAAALSPLTWIAAALAGVSLVYAILHPLTHAGAQGLLMGGVAGVTAVACGGLALIAKAGKVQPSRSHLALAAIALLTTVDSVTDLWIYDDVQMTTNVMLVLLGAASVLVRTGWFVAVVALIWAVWTPVLVFVAEPTELAHWLIAMAMASALGVAINVTRRQLIDGTVSAVRAAEEAGVRDALTGLANRRGLELQAAPIIEAARRTGDAVHCLFVDVDELKRVNDSLGHAAGDELLVAVADALRSVTRGTDIVARWGGDEFCVLGPGSGMPPVELERRIHEHVRKVPPLPKETWDAGVSVGSAMVPPWESSSLAELLQAADKEMYRRRALRRTTSPRIRSANTER
jgi:diguanylate cyclase (GGDEF)-like protein